MALKVLLADDSVPAQNMGKKILTEAGYEVLAVGNGLEALRKIADSVPDIAILDIFMPGYTGLEICARLRGNAVTADLPVILTVGKLEPYRPEDGEQVRSNAVIVKPFASSELVSAVRSLVGLPFAVRRDTPEVDAPPASAPAPEAAPIEDFEEPEPMPIGLGFDPDAKRTAFSASAVEEPPAFTAEAAGPLAAEESGLAGYGSPEASALSNFDLEDALPGDAELPSFGPLETAADSAPASPLVEWWQPSQETVEELDAAKPEVGSDLEIPATATLAAPAAAAPAVEETRADYGANAWDALGEEPVQQAAASGSPAIPLDAPAATDAGKFENLGDRVGDYVADYVADDVADNVVDNVAEDLAEDVARPGAEPATLLPASPDHESRLQAFEALFNSDEPIPVEERSPGVPDVLAHPAGDVPQPPQPVLQAHSEMPVALHPSTPTAGAPGTPEESPDESRLLASASSAITENLEPAAAGNALSDDAFSDDASSLDELRLDAESLADWLSSGKIPQRTSPPVSVPLENSAAQLAPAGGSFYAGIAEEASERLQAAAAVTGEPMVCYLAKGQAATEATPESSIYPSLEPAAQTFAYLETLGTQVEAPQSAMSDFDASESDTLESKTEVAPTEVAPVELACPASELPKTDVKLRSQTESAQLPAEMASAQSWSAENLGEPDSEPDNPGGDAKRVHQAVESVFDRFRPLLIAAIARELTKRG